VRPSIDNKPLTRSVVGYKMLYPRTISGFRRSPGGDSLSLPCLNSGNVSDGFRMRLALGINDFAKTYTKCMGCKPMNAVRLIEKMRLGIECRPFITVARSGNRYLRDPPEPSSSSGGKASGALRSRRGGAQKGLGGPPTQAPGIWLDYWPWASRPA